MKVFLDPVTSRNPFGGVVATLADSLIATPLDGVNVAAVHPSTITLAESLVADVHDPDYISAVKTGFPRDLAESNGYVWMANDYPAAVARSAALIAAVIAAVDHGLTGGALAPGMHRATRQFGLDGCTFNGFAAAVRWVTTNRPDHTVVILDLSAEFAAGTSEMIETMDNVSLVDLSSHGSCFANPGEVVMHRLGSYDAALGKAIARVLDHHPDVVIANMSIDDDLTDEAFAGRDQIVADAFRRAEVPVAFTIGQEAGRRPSAAEIALLHRTTIQAFA